MGMRILAPLGAFVLGLVTDTARLWSLAYQSSRRLLIGPFRGETVRYRSVVEQIVRAGNGSLFLVILIGALVGMILELQSAYQLRAFGAENLTAALVTVSVTRELAPLLTAILVAGRIGSAITAELATMSVSQETDALIVMGIDPVTYLVLPRIIALLVALPALTIFADVAGILGGCGVAMAVLGLGASTYIQEGIDALKLQDFLGGVLKAFAFAGIIGVVGCQQGLDTRGGAEEVGRSTTSSVVRSIVLIIGADLFVTALLYWGPSQQ